MKNKILSLLMVACFALSGSLSAYKIGKYALHEARKAHLDSLSYEPDFSAPKKYKPLIRLMTKDGMSSCSAVVITPTLALTAAHCTIDHETMTFTHREGFNVYPDGESEPYVSKKIVRDIKNMQFFKGPQLTLPLEASVQCDIGLIEGDFSDFENAKFDNDDIRLEPSSFKMPFEIPEPMSTCGYPHGSKTARCTQFQGGFYGEGFMFVGHGLVFPGMSGGMLMSLQTGELLGIISRIREPDGVGIAPVAHVLDMFRIKH